MKKTVVLVLLLFIVVLSACSSKDTPVDSASSDQKKNDKEEQIDSKDSEPEKNVEKESKEVSKPSETSEPTYMVNPENSSIEPLSEEANEKVVLLTIDDAPDKYALQMAKTLKELDAGAIFFVNGHFLNTPEEKEVLKKIHEMGFIIGNHTYSHPFLPDLSTDKQKEEIIKVNKLVEQIIGEKPVFFRAPNGANTAFSEQLIKEEGMTSMNWSYGYDYFKPYMNTEKLTKAMISGKAPEIDIPYSLLKPGANLLMHDREWTANALHDIVVGLRDKGYEILDPHLIQTK
ncbi:polysaccharide deacetylase family protein [Virgibacillus flavescens]|uniref:polysaccharide deacetylase family protein n=1 Tax=Virgibacillus flavescens TaxID=1611422 RepID=UPI003D3571D1